MATVASTPHTRITQGYQQWLPDMQLGLQNLLLHRLRSLLTMLGMIFGVAAVVSMLSIGAGARQKVMALIEQMGVHNLIVEAKETTEWQAHQKIRKLSQGLSFQDYRVIRDDVSDIVAATPRKRMTPSKTIPKSQQDPPTVYGVNPNYLTIAGLHVLQGRFFDEDEETRGAPVAVLGAAARSSLFGSADPVGQYVKANETWFRVIGVASPQLSSQTEVAGVPTQDLNNIMYVPLNSAILRLEDSFQRRARRDRRHLPEHSRRRGYGLGGATGAGDPRFVASFRRRFQRDRARRTARRTEADGTFIQRRDGRDRVNLSAGRRDWHHEHHAGQHSGADARNWRSTRRGRAAVGHHPPVRGRSYADFLRGRKLRHHVRLRDVAPDCMVGRMVDHRDAQFYPARIHRLDHGWTRFWNLPCSQSRAPRSSGSHSLGVGGAAIVFTAPVITRTRWRIDE